MVTSSSGSASTTGGMSGCHRLWPFVGSSLRGFVRSIWIVLAITLPCGRLPNQASILVSIDQRAWRKFELIVAAYALRYDADCKIPGNLGWRGAHSRRSSRCDVSASIQGDSDDR